MFGFLPGQVVVWGQPVPGPFVSLREQWPPQPELGADLGQLVGPFLCPSAWSHTRHGPSTLWVLSQLETRVQERQNSILRYAKLQKNLYGNNYLLGVSWAKWRIASHPIARNYEKWFTDSIKTKARQAIQGGVESDGLRFYGGDSSAL